MMESKMTNSEILAYRGSQLSGLDKQRRFVLLQLTRPMGCPNCATALTYVEAAGLTVDTVDLSKPSDDPCKCSGCSRELKYTVPMMGDCHWTLVPVAPTKAA